MYAFSLPGFLSIVQNNLNNFFFDQELPADVTGTNFAFLLRLADILEIIPLFAVFFGVLTIFIPQINSARLERKYDLSEPNLGSPALREIAEFLHQHAPGIPIKATLQPANYLARVYALGYRKTGIAIFPGLVKLWRFDRSSAETILLHEVAHYRHGDALIVGAGSHLRTIVEHWFFLYLLLGLIPFVLVLLDQTITFFQELTQLNQLGIPLPSLLPSAIFHKITQFLFLFLPGIFLQFLGLLFWMVNIFILPLIGIWCAELNADKTAMEARESPDDLIQSIEKLHGQIPWWDWLLNRMTHPPNKMRQWIATHSKNTTGLVLLLLLFPLAYLIKLLAITGRALTVAPLGITVDIGAGITTFFMTVAPTYLLIAILLLLWPLVSGYWERFFCGIKRTSNRGKYKVYFLSAAIVTTLSVIGYLLDRMAFR
jgi:Zn-dependent protease with chaperone function